MYVMILAVALCLGLAHMLNTSMLEQETEREAVEAQTHLLAFDRQNHMGASDSAAHTLKRAIKEEAEAMLSDKKVVNGAVNIAGNTEKMKVSCRFHLPVHAYRNAGLIPLRMEKCRPLKIKCCVSANRK